MFFFLGFQKLTWLSGDAGVSQAETALGPYKGPTVGGLSSYGRNQFGDIPEIWLKTP